MIPTSSIRSCLRTSTLRETAPETEQTLSGPKSVKKRVKIVIPLYCTDLRDEEIRSIERTCSVLSRHPIVLLIPETLDPAPFNERFPGHEIMRVSDEWLGTKHGIAGYNRMMMSREFYALFSDTEYILICQADCWIFRDEVDRWCDAGYDYVGAPSPRRPIYNWFPVRWYLALRRKMASGILRQDLVGKVYNGGLSLRRVASFLQACDDYREEIAAFLSRHHHLYNEDVFWSLVPVSFRYPPVDAALGFSFDVKPDFCYKLNGRRLPFGCHGWYKKPVCEFWEKIIG